MTIQLIITADNTYTYNLTNVELKYIKDNSFRIRSHLKNNDITNFKTSTTQFQQIYSDMLNKNISKIQLITEAAEYTCLVAAGSTLVFDSVNYPKSPTGHAINALSLR